MLQSTTLYPEVSAALRKAHRAPPPALKALRFLGVSNETVAKFTGISPPLVSLWVKGHERVAEKHMPKLTALLRAAHVEAVKVLGEAAARTNPPELKNNFNRYRDRVRRAGEILEGFDQE